MPSGWTTVPPVRPGWYWYRGWRMSQRHVRLHLVREHKGSLCITIFEGRESAGDHHPQPVSTIEGQWQWCKPLAGHAEDGSLSEDANHAGLDLMGNGDSAWLHRRR